MVLSSNMSASTFAAAKMNSSISYPSKSNGERPRVRIFSRFRRDFLVTRQRKDNESSVDKTENLTTNADSDVANERREQPVDSSSFDEVSRLDDVIVSVREGSVTEVEKDDGVTETPLNDLVLSTSDSMGEVPQNSCCLDTIYCETMGLNRMERMFGRRHSNIPLDKKSQSITTRSKKTKSKGGKIHRSVSLGGEPRLHESIECVIAKQQNDEDIYHDNDAWQSRIVAPSGLHQSLVRNRLYPTLSNRSFKDIERTKSTRKPETLEKGHQHKSSFDELPNLASISDRSGESSTSTGVGSRGSSEHASSRKIQQCVCSQHFTPVFKPTLWPQRPLFLRPTPNGGTRVKGIRYAGETEYIWGATNSDINGWYDVLREKWKKPAFNLRLDLTCQQCTVLPINNGNELPGESLVTDFESDLFDGSLLVRIRGAEGTTKDPYDDTKGYFSDVNRRYQVVIQGRFKKSIPWTECMSGISLDRPCGKLPAKWIVKGAVNLIKFFAPQLDARVDGANPHTFSPLGSTPQAIIVDKSNASNITDIAGNLVEPYDASHTLFQVASPSASPVHRARLRKKSFDKIFSEKDRSFVTDPNKVYTFEFLQHLINFEDLSIDLGSMFGSIKLSEVLDGQPIQIRAKHKSRNLWSFDVWHEFLYADSLRHEG